MAYIPAVPSSHPHTSPPMQPISSAEAISLARTKAKISGLNVRLRAALWSVARPGMLCKAEHSLLNEEKRTMNQHQAFMIDRLARFPSLRGGARAYSSRTGPRKALVPARRRLAARRSARAVRLGRVATRGASTRRAASSRRARRA